MGTSEEDDLLTLEREIFDAFEQPGDKEAIDRLYAEDFLAINADGSTSFKEEALEIVESGVFPVSERISNEKSQIRRYDDTAIISGRSTWANPGDNPTAVVSHTQIWTKEDDQWQMVGWQGTPVEGGPAAGPDF